MVSKDSRIYVYKLTTDNGGAPCLFNKLISLAICKPQIRSTIKCNDWLIGFGGRSTIGERLIFVARITEKLYDGKYYKDTKYYDRPDCIYRWNNENRKYIWTKGKKYHKNGESLEHDLGKEKNDYNNADILLSNEFSYLGGEGNEEYKSSYPNIKLLVESLGKGHRVNYANQLKDDLTLLIESTMLNKMESTPTQLDDNISCNQENDCLKLIEKEST